MFTPYTKKLLLLLLLTGCFHAVFASSNKVDSLTLTEQEQAKQKISKVDSLKQELDVTIDDSLKATLYTQIASAYLKFDTITDKKIRRIRQNEAIGSTMSAIHFYSRYNDSTGLQASFDALAKIYHAQHKYPQAKWFILQANSLARAKNDNPNVIATLIELSSIKTDIKDYTLAMRDLNEALIISSKNHYPKQESQVQLHYALLYNVMRNYSKATIALNRHNAIDDSIRRDEEAKILAKLAAKDSVLTAKKKLYTISARKVLKTSSTKRIALL